MATKPRVEVHDRLLPLPAVKEIAGLSKAMIYRLIREGRFPAPYKPGGVASRWSEREIMNWKAKLAEARGAA